jgi:predicted amidophosphoribosyltransferase
LPESGVRDLVYQSRSNLYLPDDRANRLEAWKFEQSGAFWFLHFRSSPETKRHIIGALPRAMDVRTLKYDPEWPYRIRLDFEPPDELSDFLEILKKVLVIEIKQRGFLDAAVALDLYRRKDADGYYETTIGKLIGRFKGYGRVDRMAADEAGRILCHHMSEVARKHQWLAGATRILPIPGHTSSKSAASLRLGAAVAQNLGIQITEVTPREEDRVPAKQMTRLERADLLHGYHVDEKLDGQTVLILDDFYHTGWTMAGVANAARRAGARTVLGLAAVRNYQR